MNRTNIEWVRNPDGTPGYSWNVITGCLNHVNGLCKGGGFPCYAYKLAHGRLKQRYLANRNLPFPMMDDELLKTYNDPFYPRFWEERLKDIERPPYPFSAWECNAPNTSERMMSMPPNFHAKREKVGIFACNMSDLFGIGIPKEWTRRVLDAIRTNGVDRFYLTTKQPQNLIKFSPFPENCWVGVTATNDYYFRKAIDVFRFIDAKVKFISFEPLLDWSDFFSSFTFDQDNLSRWLHGIGWLIIGAQTKPYKPPKIEWVREIVEAADKVGIKVFLKDNLKPLLGDNLRQELPK